MDEGYQRTMCDWMDMWKVAEVVVCRRTQTTEGEGFTEICFGEFFRAAAFRVSGLLHNKSRKASTVQVHQTSSKGGGALRNRFAVEQCHVVPKIMLCPRR